MSSSGWLQLLMSAGTVWWGVWLLFAFDTFDSNPVFSIIAKVASEDAWGVVAVLFGTISLVATLARHFTTRRYALLVLIGWWALVSILLIEGNFRSTAAVVYPWIATITIYSYICLGAHGK